MTDHLIPFVVICLAGWTLSSLLVNEDGPFAIFQRLRAWAGVQLSTYLDPSIPADWATIVYVAERKELSPDEDGAYALPYKISRSDKRKILGEVGWILTCVWCTSMWVCFALFGVYWILFSAMVPDGFIAILYPFAARTVIIWIEKVLG